jgi:hypothetical protein
MRLLVAGQYRIERSAAGKSSMPMIRNCPQLSNLRTLITDTFYKWKKRHPEFAEAIVAGRSVFQESQPQKLDELDRNTFVDYLCGRVMLEITIEKVGENSFGKYRETQKRVTRLPPPRWAIERVIGKPLDILDALKILAEAKIL